MLGVLMTGMLARAQADAVTLAADGQARLPVVVGAAADEQVLKAAADLAAYLQRISGAKFDIARDAYLGGIRVGLPGDFALAFESPLGKGVFQRDEYVIKTHDGQLYVLGATPLAVEFAVWDLLGRFGYRYFFPSPTWEVIPDQPVLRIEIDDHQKPSYYTREAPRGSLNIQKREWGFENWKAWQVRNRTASSFDLNTSHVYGKIIAANQAAFDAHPEYYALIDGKRDRRAQPEVSNPQVQRMFIDYALQSLAEDPARDSVSMDPLDGPAWSQSAEAQALGSPTDQAVTMANLVAQAVVQKFGSDKYVGMYGYSHHSPPPTVEVHPHVIVSLATSFIRGGYSFEELLEGWSQKADMVGIRDYYAVTTWAWSMPGRSAASNLGYLSHSIAHFHSRGARFMTAESDDTWGANGLGYYLSSQLLWDVSKAANPQAIIEDFLDKSFGPAKEPMRAFYQIIDGDSRDPRVPTARRQINDDMIGRMFRSLAEARALVKDEPAMRARVDDLILYTHYVHLYQHYLHAQPADQQRAFDEMMTFAWRIRGTMMTESLGLVRAINRMVSRSDHVKWPEGNSRSRPSDIHKTLENTPYSSVEIQTMLEAGVARHDLVDVNVTLFEGDGPLRPTHFPAATRGAVNPKGLANRGAVTAYLWTDDGTLPRFTFRAGLIYTDRGELRIDVYDANDQGVFEANIPPDKQDHVIDLQFAQPGLYRLEITNPRQGYTWDYQPRGSRLTIKAGREARLDDVWLDRMYFYVPKGREKIVLAAKLKQGRYSVIDGDGNVIEPQAIETQQGLVTIPVAKGQSGKVWSMTFETLRPAMDFLNIPPYLAYSPDELLLPEGTLEKH